MGSQSQFGMLVTQGSLKIVYIRKSLLKGNQQRSRATPRSLAESLEKEKSCRSFCPLLSFQQKTVQHKLSWRSDSDHGPLTPGSSLPIRSLHPWRTTRGFFSYSLTHLSPHKCLNKRRVVSHCQSIFYIP